MSYYIYILYSVSKDKFYVGHTEDILRRLQEHIVRRNLGVSDWEIKYSEIFATRSEAMKRELYIKSRKSRSYLIQLIGSAG